MEGSGWTAEDELYMARAIRLAGRGRYTADPNPRVGCVLVKDGARVGEGWHRVAGGPHAEIMALGEAGAKAKGATCYLSLEPCCHHGRTPPCTDALLRAEIARVLAAMTDPNPRMRGRGLAMLRDAGVAVGSGLLEAEARKLNPGFIRRMCQGQPYVRCKLGLSLDGRSALRSGLSRWITSPEARRDVQRLRASSSAVMTGIGTVLADDPALSVREAVPGWGGRQPLRVVLDSHLRFPASARMLGSPGQTLVLTTATSVELSQALACQGAEVVPLEETSEKVDLVAALAYLARREVNEVLLEAGPTLSGAMLHAGLVDELIVYLAPKLIGDSGRGALSLPVIETLEACVPLRITDIRAVGPDWRVTASLRDES